MQADFFYFIDRLTDWLPSNCNNYKLICYAVVSWVWPNKSIQAPCKHKHGLLVCHLRLWEKHDALQHSIQELSQDIFPDWQLCLCNIRWKLNQMTIYLEALFNTCLCLSEYCSDLRAFISLSCEKQRSIFIHILGFCKAMAVEMDVIFYWCGFIMLFVLLFVYLFVY